MRQVLRISRWLMQVFPRRAVHAVACRVARSHHRPCPVTARPVIHIAGAPRRHRSRGARLVLPAATRLVVAPDDRVASATGSVEAPRPDRRRSAVVAGAVAGARRRPPPAPTGGRVAGRPAARRRRGADASPDARLARPRRPAALDGLTGYRWPLPPAGSRCRSVRRRGARGSSTASRSTTASTSRRSVATGSWPRTTASSWPRAATTTRRWAGSATCSRYLDRLDAKSLWTTLPIVVVIDDGNGYRSIYAHFSRSSVKKGQRSHGRRLLGYEGQTGRASGCHLHYGLFSPLETRRLRRSIPASPSG